MPPVPLSWRAKVVGVALVAVWAGLTVGAGPASGAVQVLVDRVEQLVGWDEQRAVAEAP